MCIIVHEFTFIFFYFLRSVVIAMCGWVVCVGEYIRFLGLEMINGKRGRGSFCLSGGG